MMSNLILEIVKYIFIIIIIIINPTKKQQKKINPENNWQMYLYELAELLQGSIFFITPCFLYYMSVCWCFFSKWHIRWNYWFFYYIQRCNEP